MHLHNPAVLDFFEEKSPEKWTYTPTGGISGCQLNIYTEHSHLQSILLFKLLDQLGVEYALFAGSSLGMVRSRKMMSWADDHDIIILNDKKSDFPSKIIPELKRYRFKLWGWGTDKPRGTKDGVTYISGKYFEHKAMRVDIFWSYFDSEDRLRNDSRKGLYHKHGLHKDIVLPFTRHTFHGETKIPFFANYRKEIEICYGEVITNCIVSTHTEKMKNISVHYPDWTYGAEDFENLIAKSIENTKTMIKDYDSWHPSGETLHLNGDTLGMIDLLSLIASSNASTIVCDNLTTYFREIPTIKFYFPCIRIHSEFGAKSLIHPIYLNYVDRVITKNKKMYEELQSFIYISKPEIVFTDKV